ncbi:uracil-DNA glycosylase [Vibrio sp. TH_r3]|uniref:uracil-DNA glycosylase n=1 Tax=Vibrio sp. TH_r3 TaxID=3082084 RepID=UPI002954434A|nr:uracil-DNA glycosylase [Vibrio sp. TH_r3]MDV7105210.1 uracil-DNA glycosylase [Vibrio sp. TH_r3]
MSNNVTWQSLIEQEKQKPYLKQTLEFIQSERDNGKEIYPADADVFSAFQLTQLTDVKVVIIGQDPYHGPNQAHGLSFSVLPGIKIPPSLANIYKELSQDIEGFEAPKHGYLKHWAEQGVLLINTVLTVERGKAHSHSKTGWESFTDIIISLIDEHCQDVVFLLWGTHAQNKGKKIDRSKHYILTAPHPSPLSAYRGFFGCQHFSKTNQILLDTKRQPIDWQLPKLPM